MKATQDAEMVLIEGLGNNIIEHIGNVELGKSIKIFVRNKADEVVGGVIASVFGGWVYISLLWIEESLRNLGYGTRLMDLIETEAIELGCQYAHVDTYSFEAKPFYERSGYELFATLEDYPKGYSKYFLKKRLAG
jgi:GNAT superfamily N-acetyltransferase